MKKAKRLLAVLLAAVMIFSAACVPTYAYRTPSNDYHTPTETRTLYYFTYEQGCGWILDMLEDLLADLNIKITIDELNNLVNGLLKDVPIVSGMKLNIFTDGVLGFIAGLNMDDYLNSAGSPNGDIDLRSIDGVITSLYGVLTCLQDDSTPKNINNITKLFSFNLFGDLLDHVKTYGVLNNQITRVNSNDKEVLEMIVNWIGHLVPFLTEVVAGTFYWGDLLPDLIEDMVEGLDLDNLDIFLKNMLYSLLVDSEATALPEGKTLDSAIQDVVNMALITGTGSTPETGANSILGADFKALIGEKLSKLPGGADITTARGTFEADRNCNGVIDDNEKAYTMNTYQFVSNLISGLLDGMLGPMLSEILCDAVGVEITEEFPLGDPALMTDQMFALIVGLVESLLTQNGAPDPVYTEEEKTYPVAKINALVDWLFNDGALDVFIGINYQGIKIKDNFMSLLNDLIRLLVNMLPSLGLFADSAHLSYSADEMNAVWYYNANGQLVDETAADAVDETYITYETRKVLYATEYIEEDDVRVPVSYKYLDGAVDENDADVNISDPNGADYVNPDFIRSNFVIKTEQVYATVVKMALNDLIDGCYFPEWTTDMCSVLAYGLAALAAPATPQNNYYERLDAYHEMQVNNASVVIGTDGSAVDPIPYSTWKTIPLKDENGNPLLDDNQKPKTKSVEVPTGALNIGCSYLAAYLNTILKLDRNLDTDTTLEKFAGEFLLWGASEYVPMLAGSDSDNNGSMDTAAVWKDEFNTYIIAVYGSYENYLNNVVGENENYDAIYDLLDSTLFSLIPTSWLPDINSSTQFINEWLLSNLVKFDIQAILGLLSVNNDPDAELNKYPLINVLFNVIDRVLAVVFNDTGMLLPAKRTDVVANQNLTTISSFDALLSCKVNGSPSTDASLPFFLNSLLNGVNTYKSLILGTLLPLLASSDYVRPFDEEYLTGGTYGMSTWKVDDLETYIDYFNKDTNASEMRTFDNIEDAEAAVAGDAAVIRVATIDDSGAISSVTYQVTLNNNTIYGVYDTTEEAEEVVELLSDAYVRENTGNSISILSETGEPANTYTVMTRWSYLDTATSQVLSNDAKDEFTDADGNKHVGGDMMTYGGFQFADLSKKRTAGDPFVTYEDGVHRFFAYEDFGSVGYYYAAVNTALKDGSEYASSYRSFAENDLSSAYGDWLMYSVNAQLKKINKYDANDDGVITTDTASDVYDGDPGIPEAMYPYYNSTSTTQYTYKESWSAPSETVTVKDFTPDQYEQLALALEHGEENYVRLSNEDAEAVVRLAIESIKFDITPHSDEQGNIYYNAGSVQWDNLPAEDLTKLNTWLANNDEFRYVTEVLEDGTTGHFIERVAFRQIGSDFSLGGYVTSSAPITDAQNTSLKNGMSMLNDTTTYAQELQMQMYKSYVEFIKTLNKNRDNLYNAIDNISYRYEVAEAYVTSTGEKADGNRARVVDTTMLEWIINHSASAYKDDDTKLRNYEYSGDIDVTTGKETVRKIYSSASFEKFRNAYDYAVSIRDYAKSQLLDESELTQSFVTEAYIGLLKAFLQLTPFKGEADWVQLDEYIAIAEKILGDSKSYDPLLGYYESGLTTLDSTLDEALALRNDSTIDGDDKTKVDNMAAALRQAIGLLTFKNVPSLISKKAENTQEDVVGIVKMSDTNNRIVGQVYGLEEFVGATMDLVELVGMRVDDPVNKASFYIVGSGRGYGTGAYYRGVLGTDTEAFRYYAVVYGDINGDANIDGTDASAIEVYISLNANNDSAMGSAEFEAADANHDGHVDNLDVGAIVSHYTFVDEITQGEHSSTITA